MKVGVIGSRYVLQGVHRMDRKCIYKHQTGRTSSLRNGVSNGTRDSIQKAKELNIPVIIISFNEETDTEQAINTKGTIVKL